MQIVPSLRHGTSRYHRPRARPPRPRPRPHPHGIPPRPMPRSTGVADTPSAAAVGGRTHRPRRPPVIGPRPEGPVPSNPGIVYHLNYYTYGQKYIKVSYRAGQGGAGAGEGYPSSTFGQGGLSQPGAPELTSATSHEARTGMRYEECDRLLTQLPSVNVGKHRVYCGLTVPDNDIYVMQHSQAAVK
jgi:hypothetical protein